MQPVKPFVLLILDGFGYREQSDHNAIAQAHTPYFDKLWQNYPHTLIEGSGGSVGLPAGQMGNSEVGHLNLGAGRVVAQDFTRISESIADQSFFENTVLNQAISRVLASDSTLHVMGLLSAGGVHSHENHILACLELAAKRGLKKICLHAFLDGRDTAPKAAKASIDRVNAQFAKMGHGQIVSMIGRYYAMDRDNRWDRIEKAYDLLTQAKAKYRYESATDALDAAYKRGETDEFVQASVILDESGCAHHIEKNDVIIFMNYRADRARQLTRTFVDEHFSQFKTHRATQDSGFIAEFVSLTKYADDLKTHIAFAPNSPQNTLGECIADAGFKQLRLAETEKYAHVTFFFNGGRENTFAGEVRKLIASPDVATYDLKPQMSAPELTDNLVEAIESQQYRLIVCNYANPDMVGHTGNFEATVKAIECIDSCLERITRTIIKTGGEMILTADHGNAEYMYNPQNKQPHTAHTNLPVPLVYVGKPARITAENGALCDIAPTILSLMDLPIPPQMSHKLLLEID